MSTTYTYKYRYRYTYTFTYTYTYTYTYTIGKLTMGNRGTSATTPFVPDARLDAIKGGVTQSGAPVKRLNCKLF